MKWTKNILPKKSYGFLYLSVYIDNFWKKLKFGFGFDFGSRCDILLKCSVADPDYMDPELIPGSWIIILKKVKEQINQTSNSGLFVPKDCSMK